MTFSNSQMCAYKDVPKIITKRLWLAILLLFLIMFTNVTFAVAYKVEVHRNITENAIYKIQTSFDNALTNIGFNNGAEAILKREGLSVDQNRILDWIKYGSEWEDDIWPYFSKLGRKGPLYNHFYCPLFDLGYYKQEAGVLDEIGQSIIERANDFVTVDTASGWDGSNEWAYQMAREFYYAALTGDSSSYYIWHIRDQLYPLGIPPFLGKKNMNQAEKERFYTYTFQALGHIMHLIQDSSVPAHTRNDLHADKKFSWFLPGVNSEPYEEWTKENIQLISNLSLGPGSDPWDKWKDHPDVQVPDVFVDTVVHPSNSNTPDSIAQSESFDQGLAEYSCANFCSEDRISYYDLPNQMGNSFIETKNINGKDRKFRYRQSSNFPDGGVEHLFRDGIISLIWPVGLSQPEEILYTLSTVDDPLVHEDYAEKLIPRAVGYSAGFLEYFFRGQLEITAPDEFVYAIIDGSVTPQQFTKIKAKVRNISPRDKDDQGSTISYEPIGEGQLIAVAKYKKIPDYDMDLNNYPPTEVEMNDVEFSYSVSAPIDIDSLSYEEPEEFEFDFSEDQIPVGITDLYLQVIFKGDLGNEEDIGIAVGMKDLNEPDFYTVWNSTDMIELYGVLRNPQDIYDDPNLFNLVDTNHNGVLDEDECQIDPFNIKFSIAFLPQGATSVTQYNAVYNSMNPQRYGKIIVLTGEPQFQVFYKTESDILGIKPYLYNMSGTVNQMNETGWADTGVIDFRGINSHFYFTIYNCCNNTGVCSGNHDFPNVEGEDLIPVPATGLVP